MIPFFRKWLRGLQGAPSLSPQGAQTLIKSGAVLLDVRNPAERRSAFIPGSLHIPLDQLPARIGTLPQNKTIICQCASGMRSAQATRILKDAGLDARNLGGGIAAWRGAGLPTTSRN
ncbi:rhodanese-like domain-containing protein [Deinococcus sp. D7000]|nr:rhodanese-like domain-containing protein [Deinococcus sp. D7000]